MELQDLIFGSPIMCVAGWLIFMAGGILIAEIILVIYGLQSTWNFFTVIVSYVVSSIMYVYSLALETR